MNFESQRIRRFKECFRIMVIDLQINYDPILYLPDSRRVLKHLNHGHQLVGIHLWYQYLPQRHSKVIETQYLQVNTYT